MKFKYCCPKMGFEQPQWTPSEAPENYCLTLYSWVPRYTFIARANHVDPDQPTYLCHLIEIYNVCFLIYKVISDQKVKIVEPDQSKDTDVLVNIDLLWSHTHQNTYIWNKGLTSFKATKSSIVQHNNNSERTLNPINPFLHIYAFLRLCDQCSSRSAGTSVPSDLDLHWSHFGQK
jgi:hypothetical protein